MFKGFQLSPIVSDMEDHFVAKGRSLYNADKARVQVALNRFISEGKIDGSKLQSHWFPTVDADVFISHSHKDERMALILAGWMAENFGLKPFIDSCVWGCADSLLKKIDDLYCRNEGESTYSYEKRNRSTSHIHMMLSTALSMMIDRTECLMFLNTPRSITSEGVIDTQTESPWIYAELLTAKSIRRTIPNRHQQTELSFSANEAHEKTAAAFRMHYTVDLSPFAEINADTLTTWYKQWRNINSHPLDVLYDITPKENIDALMG